ncbi:DCC1-like thiol-disulfide oxidoreductase family protein [Arenibacter sp. M-2]|uniref:thiol-disulfide oxidoreductase DCC family protein n=1 Tax=Arenibacter sp. M-2 TaxID=3053612 RepID=UPI0025707D63|nr:DCC1-like thiol-disulfide oxidoreductase family protein [Arenibacter sp. M-2]MDL5515085.1 DCC1-like thiol-disulfide oxidoreductase family protein [Arenibacter sp. M-2]
MERKFQSGYFPSKPCLIWDGKCGFCKFWIVRWKILTRETIDYVTYQSIYFVIPDISEQAFGQAIHLIEPDGRVYKGAEAAYRTLFYSNKWNFLYHYYQKLYLFQTISEIGYKFVSNHRPLLFKVTKILFGKNPARLRHYWLIYLMVILFSTFLF